MSRRREENLKRLHIPSSASIPSTSEGLQTSEYFTIPESEPSSSFLVNEKVKLSSFISKETSSVAKSEKPVQRKSILNYLNLDEDFEKSPPKKIKKAPAPKRTKKSSSKAPKKQPKIKNALLKQEEALNDAITFHSLTEDVDPEELRLALAISRSEAEAKGISVPDQIEELKKFVYSPEKRKKSNKLRGKWSTRICALTYRDTNLEQEKLMKKVEEITQEIEISLNLTKCGSTNNELIHFFTSSILSEMHTTNKIVKKCEDCEEIDDINQYYVEGLFEPTAIKAGHLLKDYKRIPGRELSPTKHIEGWSYNIIDESTILSMIRGDSCEGNSNLVDEDSKETVIVDNVKATVIDNEESVHSNDCQTQVSITKATTSFNRSLLHEDSKGPGKYTNEETVHSSCLQIHKAIPDITDFKKKFTLIEDNIEATSATNEETHHSNYCQPSEDIPDITDTGRTSSLGDNMKITSATNEETLLSNYCQSHRDIPDITLTSDIELEAGQMYTKSITPLNSPNEKMKILNKINRSPDLFADSDDEDFEGVSAQIASAPPVLNINCNSNLEVSAKSVVNLTSDSINECRDSHTQSLNKFHVDNFTVDLTEDYPIEGSETEKQQPDISFKLLNLTELTRKSNIDSFSPFLEGMVTTRSSSPEVFGGVFQKYCTVALIGDNPSRFEIAREDIENVNRWEEYACNKVRKLREDGNTENHIPTEQCSEGKPFNYTNEEHSIEITAVDKLIEDCRNQSSDQTESYSDEDISNKNEENLSGPHQSKYTDSSNLDYYNNQSFFTSQKNEDTNISQPYSMINRDSPHSKETVDEVLDLTQEDISEALNSEVEHSIDLTQDELEEKASDMVYSPAYCPEYENDCIVLSDDEEGCTKEEAHNFSILDILEVEDDKTEQNYIPRKSKSFTDGIKSNPSALSFDELLAKYQPSEVKTKKSHLLSPGTTSSSQSLASGNPRSILSRQSKSFTENVPKCLAPSTSTISTDYDDFDKMIYGDTKSVNSSMDMPTNLQSLLTSDIISNDREEFKVEFNGKSYIYKEDTEPKPNYRLMNEPELLKELDKFGLKHLKRKQAVVLLEYIYNQTHSTVINIKIAETKDVEPAVNSKYNLSDCDGQLLLRNDGVCPELPTEVYIFQTNTTKKISTALLPLHVAWFNLLRSNEKLHQHILFYRPIELQEIYTFFKSIGYRYEPQDMKRFFDSRSIIVRVMTDKFGRRRRK